MQTPLPSQTNQPTEQPQMAASSEDLSSRTVLMLVVLTLVVSFLGAFVSFVQLNAAPVAQVQDHGASAAGVVEFEIAPPVPPMTDGATGEVTLDIREP